MTNGAGQETILVVDDTPDMLELLERNLARNGYQVYTAGDANSALEIMNATLIDLVITDYRMPVINGFDLARHIRDNYSDSEVIMITGYASIHGAVEAVKMGVEEYLAKPFTTDELLDAIHNALEKLRQRRKSRAHSDDEESDSYGLLGTSEALSRIVATLKKAASTDGTVLITGESGTGKELVARAIHYHSKRGAGPFVPVNCGGIPEGLLESELFGHLKGAFTGASESRAGFFQTAQRGTIFLDEISELGTALQVKLLRVLQDKEVCMVGASRSSKVDVKIIAATNKDLNNLVTKGEFREDLFFRLNIINISVPPLREREEDILLLTHHFAEKYAKEFGKPIPRFSDKALTAIRSYDWPGNVRELENIVHRVVLMTDSEEIEVSDLPSPLRFSATRSYNLHRTLEEVEAEHIQRVMAETKWNKSEAATILGIDRKTLREKLKRYRQE